jgi:AraC-like DNA-binding protein
MQQQKPYLNEGLNIEQLATMVDSNRHHLSQVLNEKLKKSFYDYINHYRVEEAKTLLADPAKASYKIASIAYDAGFNSLSTFNDVFRKSTGVTPSQFKKQVEEISRKKRV